MNHHEQYQRKVGRAAVVNPANRFERIVCEDDFAHLEDNSEKSKVRLRVPTELIPDQSRSIIVENESPDIPFRYSINPYRGCEHGCAYCYARPGHEMLGMNAGMDFETKILVKQKAAELLRDELNRPSWHGDQIVLSGVTDCYQPVERRLLLTRRLLEVLLEARQATGIITKNALVLRDLDLLKNLATWNLLHVNVSITSLDAGLTRKLEPRTSIPSARLAAMEALSEAGIPVGVMIAPVIPGLNDQELPAILEAAREVGARAANYQLVRLPLSVLPVFTSWLAANFPESQTRIESLIRQTRDGQLSDSQFGRRHRGQGTYAAQIQQIFAVFRRKYGLDFPLPPVDCTQFRPPRNSKGQMRFF